MLTEPRSSHGAITLEGGIGRRKSGCWIGISAGVFQFGKDWICPHERGLFGERFAHNPVRTEANARSSEPFSECVSRVALNGAFNDVVDALAMDVSISLVTRQELTQQRWTPPEDPMLEARD